MKIKDLFNKNLEVNCDVELWYGMHDADEPEDGELLVYACGNDVDKFEPWYEYDVKYVTVCQHGIILEVL